MTASAAPTTTQEPFLRLLFEQAPGFIAVLEGPQHVFTLVNPAYRRLVGERDVVGLPVLQAVPEAAGQGFIDLLDSVLSTGRPFVGKRMPIKLRHAEGGGLTQHVLDFVYQPVFDRDGKAVGVFCEGHDVSEQVAAEARLVDEAEQRRAQGRVFDAVLDSIEDFTYTFDRQGRFLFANKPLLNLWGKTLQEAVGLNFFDLQYPSDLATLLHQQIEHVFTTGERVRGDTFYESPTGQQGWFEYVFNPVRDAAGSIDTVAGSTRDITSRRNEQARLAALNDAERAARADAERASRLKDEFLATLSHELRTPLNAILGWAEVLRSGRLNGDKVIEAAERIARNARAQAQLIDDLLDMNGILSGKVRLAIARVPVTQPLHSAVDAVKPEAAKKELTLQLQAFDETCLVDCDPDRLQQVFWNLLANAVKFTPRGGTVSVAVERRGATVAVTVSDTGAGITPEFLPHLFERFSQADSSSTRRYGGLGLGLSIAKSLLDLHGASISVTSEGKGQGSAFTVTLPLALGAPKTAASTAVAEQAPAVLPGDDSTLVLRGARVLVVDDDAENRDLVASVLRHYGALVFPAANAAEALAAVKAEPPALMVCDIGMPDVDGYELLRRVRQFSAVPAVALTAFARDQDKQAALDAGFAAHVPKPAQPATTVTVCASVLARARATAQA